MDEIPDLTRPDPTPSRFDGKDLICVSVMSLFVLYGVQSIADRIDCKGPTYAPRGLHCVHGHALSLSLPPYYPFNMTDYYRPTTLARSYSFLGERSFHEKLR